MISTCVSVFHFFLLLNCQLLLDIFIVIIIITVVVVVVVVAVAVLSLCIGRRTLSHVDGKFIQFYSFLSIPYTLAQFYGALQIKC